MPVMITLLLAALLEVGGPLVDEQIDLAELAALVILYDAYAREPADPDVLLALTLAEARRGDLPQAERLSSLLLEHAEYRARALLCRAAIHEALGREQQAREDREEALDQLDVVLTDRAAGQRFLQHARSLLDAARRGRARPGAIDEDAPPPLDEMRAGLRQAREGS